MFAPLYKHIPALSRMDLKSKDIEHETVNENHHWLVTKYHNFPCRVNHASLYSPYAKRMSIVTSGFAFSLSVMRCCEQYPPNENIRFA